MHVMNKVDILLVPYNYVISEGIQKAIMLSINKKILILKIVLVSILTIVALASLPILIDSGNTKFKHALEWNYFIGVVFFYLLTFFFWKKV